MYVCMYDTHTPGDDVIYYKRNNISYSKSDTRWATRTNYGRELRPPLRRKNPPRKWCTLYIISIYAYDALKLFIYSFYFFIHLREHIIYKYII
jgi:hypothetical protein